jgi:hypothetical protein
MLSSSQNAIAFIFIFAGPLLTLCFQVTADLMKLGEENPHGGEGRTTSLKRLQNLVSQH